MKSLRTNIAARLFAETCFCVGLGVIVWGCWLIWPPLGYLCGGLALIMCAVGLRMGKAPREQ